MRLLFFVLFLASALVSDSWAVPGLSYKCRDSYSETTCRSFVSRGICHTDEAINYCPLTCNACDKQCIDKPGLDCQSLKKEGSALSTRSATSAKSPVEFAAGTWRAGNTAAI
ncbi:hypothetical protein L596_022913 [Steinernema carpocapsae]|uniref:ShKT domain-containing protein n=1 Tax=Steinernema carpocapsae TaxID=34508 RepID=A0A4U5MC04_STECR|nr:hypothetical protein L596_022913 [Steinernema carpocapsae]